MSDIQYYPAMEEQAGFMKFFKMIPAGGHSNCVRADFDSEIDEPLMRKALVTAFSRLPYCRIRLHQDKSNLLMYFDDGEPKIEPTSDFRKLSPEQVTKKYERLAHKGLNKTSLDCQLFAVYPALVADGKFSMMLILSHLITDGYSVMYCIRYILLTYLALKNGTELPPEGIDPLPYIKKDTELLHSPKRDSDYEWWKKYLEKEPTFTSLNGLGSREFIKGKRYGKAPSLLQMLVGKKIFHELIPGELVKKINAKAEEYNISPQIFYYLAIRSYLAYVCKTDDVTIQTTVSRRATVEEKNCGLMLANLLSFRTVVSPDSLCRDALKEIQLNQLETYRHTTTDQNQIRNILNENHGISMSQTYNSLAFTYQPYYDYSDADIRFRCSSVSKGFSVLPTYLYIMPLDRSDNLWVEYSVSAKYIKIGNVKKFHTFMLRFLDELVNNPNATVKELTEKSI